jgi:YD repeat-containing protein
LFYKHKFDKAGGNAVWVEYNHKGKLKAQRIYSDLAETAVALLWRIDV